MNRPRSRRACALAADLISPIARMSLDRVDRRRRLARRSSAAVVGSAQDLTWRDHAPPCLEELKNVHVVSERGWRVYKRGPRRVDYSRLACSGSADANIGGAERHSRSGPCGVKRVSHPRSRGHEECSRCGDAAVVVPRSDIRSENASSSLHWRECLLNCQQGAELTEAS